MAVNDCVVLKEMGLARLNQAISDAVKDGYSPHSGLLVGEGGWYIMVMKQDDTVSVDECRVVSADGIERLAGTIKNAVAGGYAPHARIVQAENDVWLVTMVKGLTGSGGGSVTSWETIEGKPAVIAAGATPAAARQAIGAGTSNIEIGTAAQQAKPGDYAPKVDDIIDLTTTLKTALKSADAAAFRAAIGAGVGNSNLVVGTTASQAKAGNWKPTVADISDASAFGRQLLQAASQSAARTLLGVVL